MRTPAILFLLLAALVLPARLADAGAVHGGKCAPKFKRTADPETTRCAGKVPGSGDYSGECKDVWYDVTTPASGCRKQHVLYQFICERKAFRILSVTKDDGSQANSEGPFERVVPGTPVGKMFHQTCDEKMLLD